ncbi:type II toxin-antitoxin system RelE/ParE family toxin [Belliella sp. DSM 107340]|uniref:Toxin n=1 Tax=Belliella calami TaxID=2923436 RepID=A0ABS9UJR0_9BACT|nr:type II toxin-antitoxin system RelE/ParE family toxin [Belliella calami]MCH7396858.1 type II toxin-antitoxin system RelE/ParE family toxin [Belliella calami]
MKYQISKEATKDLEEIWIYTFENWPFEQANRYYNLLLDEIEFISENPKSGKDFGYIREGYLRTRVKSHFIFYKVVPRENLIEVIRVLHQNMDLDAMLIE